MTYDIILIHVLQIQTTLYVFEQKETCQDMYIITYPHTMSHTMQRYIEHTTHIQCYIDDVIHARVTYVYTLRHSTVFMICIHTCNEYVIYIQFTKLI